MNQSMDPKQEQRVWSRVMSAQAARCTQEPEVCRRLEQKDIPVFDESAAMELYAAQCSAASSPSFSSKPLIRCALPQPISSAIIAAIRSRSSFRYSFG